MRRYLLWTLLLILVGSFVVATEQSKSVRPAKVSVEQFQPVELGKGLKFEDAPLYLASATIYEQESRPTNELRFQVIEEGLVLLAASWKADGNGKGKAKKARSTDASLVKDGWAPIGKLAVLTKDSGADPHTLYMRVVKPGESFRLHTRQEKAPLLIVPAPEYVAEIMAKKPVGEAPPSTASVRTANRFATLAKKGETLQEFSDEPGGGALLVGFRLTTDYVPPRWGISSVQPVYETPSGRREGERHGRDSGTQIEIQAKPGYAVGGLIGSVRGNLAGMRIVFMRQTEKGLDINDSYESRWVGARTNAEEVQIGGSGKPLIGIRGKTATVIRVLELIPAPN